MSAAAAPAFADFAQRAATVLVGEYGYGPLPPEALAAPPLAGRFPLVLSQGRQSGMAMTLHLVAFCPADGLAPDALAERLDALTELVRRVGEQGNADAQRGGPGRQVEALLLWVYGAVVPPDQAQAVAAMRREARGSSFGRWPVRSAAVALTPLAVWADSGPLATWQARLARDLVARTHGSPPVADGAASAASGQRRLALGGAAPLRAAPMSYALLALIGIFFAIETLFGGSTSGATLVRFGALVPLLVEQGQWWRLIAAAFLHIGLTHLLFNAWALYIYGPLVERLFGPLRFLAIYIIAAIGGDLLSIGLSNSISAGASGAIFGLLGATISLTLRRGGAFPGGLRDALLRNAVAVVAINAVIGFAVPGINLFAHGGGFLAGAAAGALLRPQPAIARRQQGPLGAALGIAAAVLCVAALVAALLWGFTGI